MSEGTKIRIELANDQNLEGGHWLEELRSELQQELEVSCSTETAKAPEGTMAVGITTAIVIANLVLSTIGMLLKILEHRRGKSNRSSITVKAENYSYTVTDLTDEEREKILHDIEHKKLKNLVITVND